MRLFLLTLLTFISIASRAQFFYYGTPQPQRNEVQKEKYTAPKYKGGKRGIEAFISKNFRNPSERRNENGNIVVAAIIDKKGKVSEAQIVRSVSEELNAEAIRVVKKMKFKPAKVGKKATKARIDITFPIRRGRLSFLDLNTIDV